MHDVLQLLVRPVRPQLQKPHPQPQSAKTTAGAEAPSPEGKHLPSQPSLPCVQNLFFAQRLEAATAFAWPLGLKPPRQPFNPRGEDRRPLGLRRRNLARRSTVWPATALGGANRDRTGDLLLAKQALSQLSYGPVCFGLGALPPANPSRLGRVDCTNPLRREARRVGVAASSRAAQ